MVLWVWAFPRAPASAWATAGPGSDVFLLAEFGDVVYWRDCQSGVLPGLTKPKVQNDNGNSEKPDGLHKESNRGCSASTPPPLYPSTSRVQLNPVRSFVVSGQRHDFPFDNPLRRKQNAGHKSH